MTERFNDARDYPFDPSLDPGGIASVRGLEKLRYMEDRTLAQLVYDNLLAQRERDRGFVRRTREAMTTRDLTAGDDWRDEL